MPSKWKAIGKFALSIAEAMIPGVRQVEDGVEVFRTTPTGKEKREAVKSIVLGGIMGAEFVADRDLLLEPKVAAAYDGFISSYVSFLNALSEAKAAKAPVPPHL